VGVEDELRRKNYKLMQGWREKARKLAQTQYSWIIFTLPITRDLRLRSYRNSVINANTGH